MAEDWFTRCADIINMDLTQQPSHVKVVPNSPDVIELDWLGNQYIEYPDAGDDTTDSHRDYELTIRFDALTELEARLLVSAVRGFILRRTTAVDPVFITDLNPQGVA